MYSIRRVALFGGLLVFAVAASAIGSASGALAKDAASGRVFRPLLVAESKSRVLCEKVPGRIFVSYRFRGKTMSECIAYFVTRGHESSERAVVYLAGDMDRETYRKGNGIAPNLKRQYKAMQRSADRFKTRYVFISRVGLNGSSGNHGRRRAPFETFAMNRAVDLLKARLGIRSLVLAGQSGGSTIAASILTLGRQDVACAVLGSGGFEIVNMRYKKLIKLGRKITRDGLRRRSFDPSARIDAIALNPDRRIFVIGDPDDTTTPFDQQRRFAQRLASAGHHSVLVPIRAKGEKQHSAVSSTLPMAGACALDTPTRQMLHRLKSRVAHVTVPVSIGETV